MPFLIAELGDGIFGVEMAVPLGAGRHAFALGAGKDAFRIYDFEVK